MKFITEVRVRYSETDMSKHVNNTSYFIYIEDARSAFINKVLPHLKKGSILVASQRCDYIRQAFYGQHLLVKTKVDNIGKKSFSLQHFIFDKKTEELIAKGESVEVLFNPDNQESVTIPDHIRQLLESCKEPAG